MKWYLSPDSRDPEWLARASMFHGHLGPWLVTGLLVGRDAIRRLDTPGHWVIDVTCWMPRDRQRPPCSCILDGLQASSGATLGKQNIRFNCAEEVLRDGWPVIFILRKEARDRPAQGLVYTARQTLHDCLARISPDCLEEGSRELAREDVEKLFRIRPMGQKEFELLEHA